MKKTEIFLPFPNRPKVKIRKLSCGAVMDDIQSVGAETYICADEIEKLGAFKRFTNALAILITLVPNLIIAAALASYSVVKHVYELMFPKPLHSIRGQLAVVGMTRDGAIITLKCQRFDWILNVDAFLCVSGLVCSKVTGGSNGIGREICLQLAMEGCNIAVLDVDMRGAERTCCDIRQLGVTAMPYKVCVFRRRCPQTAFGFNLLAFETRSMWATTVKWSL